MATTNRKNADAKITDPNMIDWHKIDLTPLLVTVTEMANRAGKPVPQMSNMATKTKGFPAPIKAGGIAGRVYLWPEVEAFLESREESKTKKTLSEREQLLARLAELEAAIKSA